ncbi:MAG: RNA methyltransferase [Candidatus Babeliales bacterium]|nr:RNA methyltransferase [Candidatus Babeliales bacterium]
MKSISSIQNPEIKDIAQLQTAKGRHTQNKFIAEGIRVCSTLIASNVKLVQIYATQANKDYVYALANEEKVTLVTEQVMNKISASASPSGILGVFAIPKRPEFKDLTQGLVLSQISDPGNMGTLIRTCIAMGVKTIVKIEGADIWSPKVVQATAGTIGQVNIFDISWAELVKNQGLLKLCALVVFGGQNPQEIDFTNTLMVVGNEANGIPAEWVDQCQEKLTLPMPGNTESLNAAIAGSIALYLAFNK